MAPAVTEMRCFSSSRQLPVDAAREYRQSSSTSSRRWPQTLQTAKGLPARVRSGPRCIHTLAAALTVRSPGCSPLKPGCETAATAAGTSCADARRTVLHQISPTTARSLHWGVHDERVRQQPGGLRRVGCLKNNLSPVQRLPSGSSATSIPHQLRTHGLISQGLSRRTQRSREASVRSRLAQ